MRTPSNLKVEEKEREALRVVTGGAGVLGVVAVPGLGRGEREGNTESREGSRITGGENSVAESGEGGVAERWPGEATAGASVNGAGGACCPYRDTGVACRT